MNSIILGAIGPWQIVIIVLVIVLLFGMLSLINESVQFYGFVGSMIGTGVTFLVIVWYGVCSSKAFKLYW